MKMTISQEPLVEIDQTFKVYLHVNQKSDDDDDDDDLCQNISCMCF